MKRDDDRPERRLMRRDAEPRAKKEEPVAFCTEGEGHLLFLQTSDASIVLPYHYEYATAVVPGPDGLQ